MALRRCGVAALRIRAVAQQQQQQQQRQRVLLWRPSSSSSANANADATSSADAAAQPPLPRLDDPTAAFATRTTGELLRAYVVLRLCMFEPLVRNADDLLRLSRRFLGDRLTDAVVERTFFAHFCAGTDGDSIQPVIARLRAANVQSIVDYAAEDDVAEEAAGGAAAAAGPDADNDADRDDDAATASAAESDPSSSPSPSSPACSPYQHPRGEHAVGRVYDYKDEASCDAHVRTFLSAIDAVGREPDSRGDGGFAAIKVTALGNPLLLERMTAALATVRRLFAAADAGGTGSVDEKAFSRLYAMLFPRAPPDRAARAFAELAERSRRPLDASGGGEGGAISGGGSKTGVGRGGGGSDDAAGGRAPPPERVDLVDWCLAIRLQDMPAIAARVARHNGAGRGRGGGGGLAGEVAHAALDADEVGAAERMLARVAALAERAAARRVRLMVDAEHSYFQGAIDHTSKQLMAAYNRGRPSALLAAGGGEGGEGGAGAVAGAGAGAGAGAAPFPSGGGGAGRPPLTPPVVFNTYQCYLKDSRARLAEDLELARRRGYRFAAKLGAFLCCAYFFLFSRSARRAVAPAPRPARSPSPRVTLLQPTNKRTQNTNKIKTKHKTNKQKSAAPTWSPSAAARSACATRRPCTRPPRPRTPTTTRASRWCWRK